MVINISDLIKNQEGSLEISYKMTSSDFSFMGQDFRFTEPLNVSGIITNAGSCFDLHLDVGCSFITNCSRCTKETKIDSPFSVDEKLVQDENTTTYEDVYVFEGYSIDLDEIVINSFLINTSFKYLCSEDCKGICSNCGADLNTTDCSCNIEKTDPRFAILSEFKDE